MRRLSYTQQLERDRKAHQRQAEEIRKAYQASLIEPQWYLRSIPYSQYRTTHWWKQRRTEFLLTRQSFACELCGMHSVRDESDRARINGLPRFQVHHLTYKNLGHEQDEDLVLLCCACHNLVHFPLSTAGKYWVDYLSGSIPDMAEKAKRLQPDLSEAHNLESEGEDVNALD